MELVSTVSNWKMSLRKKTSHATRYVFRLWSSNIVKPEESVKLTAYLLALNLNRETTNLIKWAISNVRLFGRSWTSEKQIAALHSTNLSRAIYNKLTGIAELLSTQFPGSF